MAASHSAELAGERRTEPAAPGFLRGGAAFLIGCVLLLWLVIAAAVTSTIVAVGAVVAGGMAVFLLTLGLGAHDAASGGPRVLERAGTPVIVAAVLFAPMNDIRPISGAAFVTVTDALLVLGFALLAPVLLTRKLTLPGFYVLGWALLVPACLVASALAANPGPSFNHFARLVAAALVLPVAFAWWRPDRSVIVKLAAAYAIGVGVSVVAAVIEGPMGTENRYDGLTTHPNFLGHTAVIAVSFVIFLLTQQPAGRRLLVGGLGLICGYGVWISGSRASFVALVIIAVLYPLFERSLLAAGGALFGLAMTLLFWSQIANASGDSALRRLLGTTHSESSDRYRLASLEEGLENFLARPLTGNGFENALEAHNIYIQIAAAAGIFGLLGFLFMLWALVAPLFTGPRPYHLLGYAVLAYLIIGALDKTLWDRFIWVGLSLALLAMLVENRDQRVSKAPARQLQRHG